MRTRASLLLQEKKALKKSAAKILEWNPWCKTNNKIERDMFSDESRFHFVAPSGANLVGREAGA